MPLDVGGALRLRLEAEDRLRIWDMRGHRAEIMEIKRDRREEQERILRLLVMGNELWVTPYPL
jgi:hypothetical protein